MNDKIQELVGACEDLQGKLSSAEEAAVQSLEQVQQQELEPKIVEKEIIVEKVVTIEKEKPEAFDKEIQTDKYGYQKRKLFRIRFPKFEFMIVQTFLFQLFLYSQIPFNIF